MIPPLSSNTMSGTDMLNKDNKKSSNTEEEKKNGRPEKPESEKSDKTLANKESQ